MFTRSKYGAEARVAAYVGQQAAGGADPAQPITDAIFRRLACLLGFHTTSKQYRADCHHWLLFADDYVCGTCGHTFAFHYVSEGEWACASTPCPCQRWVEAVPSKAGRQPAARVRGDG